MTLRVCGNCHNKLKSKNDWIYKIVSEKDILCPHCGVNLRNTTFTGMNEMPNNLIKLNDKLNSLKDYCVNKCQIEKPDNDGRMQFLATIGSLLEWLSIQIFLYQEKVIPSNSNICQQTKVNHGWTDNKLVEETIIVYEQINRGSFFIAFLFKIEVFLKAVSNTIKLKEDPTKGYYKIVTDILEELELGKKRSENHNKMIFPSYLRNSFHNGGDYLGHQGNDDEGRIDGINFIFKNNEEMIYGSHYHIYFFCNGILDVIDLILKHEKVGKNHIEPVRFFDDK